MSVCASRSDERRSLIGPAGLVPKPQVALFVALSCLGGVCLGAVGIPPAAAQESRPVAPPPSADSSETTVAPSADADRRAEFLRMWARSYFPGRSGDIFLVPEEGRFVTAAGVPFMHGSPWDYDARVPLILYGPGHVEPGSHAAEASHQDIGATLERLLGLPRRPTTTGRALSEALVGAAEAPRAVVLLVLDGFGADYFERYPEETANLRALAGRGAWFPNARANALPTATSVAHANLVTASDPALHGITGNVPFDRGRGEALSAFDGAMSENVMVPTLTDRWVAGTRGRAIVAAQGGTYYPAAALAGHGGCIFGGRPMIMAFFDSGTGGWNTNQDCYRIPGYLIDQNIQTLLEEAAAGEGGEVSAAGARHSGAVFPRFEADATVEILEMEAFGEDTVTDLLFANHKAMDYVGHAFGPGSAEAREAVAAIAREVARIRGVLEERVGTGGFVLVITADHGMPDEPGDEGRRLREQIVGSIKARFDPDGEGIVLHYDAADNQVYLDLSRMEELGVETAEVAAFLEGLPVFHAAFTEAEVREASAALRDAPEPPGDDGT